MNKEIIIKSAEDEIILSVDALNKKNGTINVLGVMNEAVFCAAVNVILIQRQLKQFSGGRLNIVPTENIEYIFEGISNGIERAFPNVFTNENFNYIRNEYSKLMADENVVNIINEHYNELYGYDGKNVL